ncbi:MAG: thioester domain-containing protein [Clostridia bacterium]|nr:thioester domain-containing protein [Clostridia bacterium]
MKRGLLALVAAIVLATMLSAGALAEDTTGDDDLYVLNFGGVDIPGYEHDQTILYPSPHYNYLVVTHEDGGTEFWNYTGHKVMNMIDPRRISQGGSGAYASIPVYCLDAVTDARAGHRYRCENLEQSDYFSPEIAGRIRAVLQHAFPYVQDMSALAREVNVWIADGGADLAPVAGLTETECITAVQSVLWRLTNRVEIRASYLGTDVRRFHPSQCVYDDYLQQPATAYTAGNCEALVQYLLALPPAKAAESLVTEAAFSAAEATLRAHPDGSFDAVVTVEIAADFDSHDALTLRAVCGAQCSQPVPITSDKASYELSLTGLADADAPITVIIEGTQTARDAFLFHPVGGRKASQTMGALTEMTVPVRASVTVERVVIGDPDSVPATGDSMPFTSMALLLSGSAGAIVILRKRS